MRKEPTETTTGALYVIGDGAACAAVRATPGGQAVRDFDCVESFLAAAGRLAPGLVLLDLDCEQHDAEAIVGRLTQRGSVKAVMVQASLPNFERGIAAMRRGAVDFLLKPCAMNALGEALKRVEKSNLPPRTPISAPLESLSNREREVLAGLARGLTNKDIAAELGISHRTVEIHRARLMRRLGACNLTALLEIAFSNKTRIAIPNR